MTAYDELVEFHRGIATLARDGVAHAQRNARMLRDRGYGPVSVRQAYAFARKDADAWAVADQRYRAAVEMREKATCLDEMLAHGRKCRACGAWRPDSTPFCECP